MCLRRWSLLALVCAGLGLIGCGADEPAKSSVKPLEEVDPEQYYGTYAGKRIDLEESATPASIEELIGSSTLTLHDNASTFTMIHAGVVFSGEYTYQTESGEDDRLMNTLALNVSHIADLPIAEIENIDDDAEALARAFPDSPEWFETYKLIMYENVWRFEVLDEGFLQLATVRTPIKYSFTRDDTRMPLAIDEGESKQNEPPNDAN